jgi:PKD repeat protein
MRRVLRLLPLVPLLFLALLLPACEELPAAPDVPNEPPRPTFFFTPVAPINAGETAVLFDSQGSRDLDGQIVSYEWNFGDGTTMQTPNTSVRHVFTDTGARCLNITYGVSLVAVDDKGGRGVASLPVTVTQLPAPTSPQCGR